MLKTYGTNRLFGGMSDAFLYKNESRDSHSECLSVLISHNGSVDPKHSLANKLWSKKLS